MKGKKTGKPTAAELDVLNILWENGPSTVRFINDKLNEKLNAKKETGYTTTLKIMQIMTEKKLLGRDSSSRSHVYTPLLKENETQKQLLDSFLNTAFGGSAMKLVMQTLGNHKTSKDEIDQIRKLLDDMDRGEK